MRTDRRSPSARSRRGPTAATRDRFLSDSSAGSARPLPRFAKVTLPPIPEVTYQRRNRRPVNLTRKAVLATAMAGSMLGGGAIGVAVFGANSGSAQTTGSSPTAPAADNGAPSGTFKPNEDATHEKGESAQREA